MAKPTQYATVVPDAGDWAALAEYIKALEERITALEEGVPPEQVTPSADGTATAEPLVVLTDDVLQQWRLSEARSVEWKQGAAWQAAGISYDVVQIMKWQATCYQQNTSEQWFHWVGDHWVRSADPTKPPPEPAKGAYSVRDGYIVDSNGGRFVAEGFCLLDRNALQAVTGPDCKPLLDHYPSCNFIRYMPWLAVPIYSWPTECQNLIEWLTAKGVVVSIGNLWTWPVVPTGDLLNQACAWYVDLARRYIDNPRVWFQTCNEPQDYSIGLPPGSVTHEHRRVYDAIRGTGSKALIAIEPYAGWTTDGLTPASEYATMTGVHWDTHFYPWMSGASSDYATCVNAVYGIAAGQQWIHSADGIMPCLMGEFSNATDGVHIDDPAYANVQAVLDVSRSSFNGCAAFCCPYWPADTGGLPNASQIADEWAGGGLTPYGKHIQGAYASGAAAATQSAAAPQLTEAQVQRGLGAREAIRNAADKWRAEHAR